MNNKEFVARHGLIAQDDSIISGSLTVTGTINATVSGSINSASFASTASYVLPLNQNVYISGSANISTTSTSGTQNLIYLNNASGNVDGLGNAIYWATNTATSPDFLGKLQMRFDGGISNASRKFEIYVSDSTIPKVVVTGAGNVGIGTALPSSSLDVRGYINVDGGINSDIILKGLYGAAPMQLAIRAAGSDAYIQHSGTTNRLILEGASGVTLKRYGTAIDIFHAGYSSGNYYANIGSSTYQNVTFYVKSAGSTSSTHALKILNGNFQQLLSSRDDGQFIIGAPGTSSYHVISPGAYYHLSSGGSVANLDFQAGAISFQYSNVHFGGTAASTLSSPRLEITRTNTNGSNSDAARFNFNISNTTGSSLVHNVLSLNPVINNSGSYSGTVRGIYYNPTLTNVSGTTNRAIETTSGDVLFLNGNFGMGTVPTDLVSLTKNQNAGTVLNIWNTNAGTAAYSGIRVGVAGLATSLNSYQSTYTSIPLFTNMGVLATDSGVGGFVINNSNASAPIIFANASTEFARFTAAGKLGLGTTNPTGQVEINGTGAGAGFTLKRGTVTSAYTSNGSTAEIGTYSSSSFNIVVNSDIRMAFGTNGNNSLGVSDTTLARLLIQGVGTTSSTKTLQVQNSNSSASLVVLDNGYVGINNILPTKTLDIVGQISLVDYNNNTVIGYQTMTLMNANAVYNTVVGYRAMYSNTSGSSNTAIGFTSLYSNSTGVSNISIGNAAMRENISGSYNIAIGDSAVRNNTTGSNYNVGIGHQSLASAVGSIYTQNVAVGGFSLTSNLQGSNNVAIGYASLYSNTFGGENVSIGASSLYSNTIGAYNVAVGHRTMELNLGGQYNTALGYRALTNNRTGSNNVGIGYFSMQYMISGSHNVGIGTYALWNVTGSENIGIGSYAGASTITGSNANTGSRNSTFIGYNTKAGSDNGINEIIIGHSALGNGSNSVTLGSDSITKTILKGNVGIGTNTPAYLLDVNGTSKVNSLVISDGSSVINKDGSLLRLHGSSGVKMTTWNGGYIDALTVQGTTGNIGINTNNPTALLNISSSLNNNIFTINYPANNSTEYAVYIGPVDQGVWTKINTNNISFKRNGAPSVIKTEGATNDLTFQTDSGNIIIKPGLVEVIKATPTTINLSGSVYITGSNNTTGYALRVSNNAGTPLITAANTGSLNILPTSTDAIINIGQGFNLYTNSGDNLMPTGGSRVLWASYNNILGIPMLNSGLFRIGYSHQYHTNFNPSASLNVSGSSNFIGNVLITGSCTITGDLIANISGSSVSSSYAATSSISLATKANSIIYSSFAGTPLTASITFDNPYPNTNYSVAVTGEDARIWTIQNKTATGFIINSNSNESLVGYTDWIATSFN